MNVARLTKGLPDLGRDVSIDEISAQGWSLLNGDLPFPVAVLSESAIQNNRRWMREFLARTGVKLAPHGKTTMCPALFHMQMEDGAWAITLATIQQVRVARAAGINRIFLMNEVVGPQDIAYLLDELKRDSAFECWSLVDSHDGLRRLVDAAKSRNIGQPLRVLIEIGYPGGRTGCRDLDLAVSLAREIKAAEPYVQLDGVEGFEGLNAVGTDAPVKAFLEKITTAAQRIDAENLFAASEIILTAGGSAFYDVVVDVFKSVRLSRATNIVLRSGCYLTHDAGLYERSFQDVQRRSDIARAIHGRFQSALEVWAYVLSVPEERRAILGAGRRDFGHDSGLPVPTRAFRLGRDTAPRPNLQNWELVAVNDQHAHLTFPAGTDIKAGDLVALGPSHPCTTFDKWQLIYVVNDSSRVSGALRTFF